jgi:hypothetical protein
VQRCPPRDGHDIELHAPAGHVTSQLQAFEQRMLSHALLPSQVMLHVDPLWHSISLHARSPWHVIAQLQPLGQRSVPPQRLDDEHSTSHVIAASSQREHSAGQLGTMQYPPTQLRPSAKRAQSAVEAHFRSAEGRSTRHAATTTIASTPNAINPRMVHVHLRHWLMLTDESQRPVA